MFTKALSIARHFTLPVVISSRFGDGKCASLVGACVAVNGDGWILTSAQLIKEIEMQHGSVLKHIGHKDEIRKFEKDTAADKKFRKKGVRTFHTPPENTVKNFSVWWGRDGAVLRDLTALPSADIALGRLDPFDGGSVEYYPVFKKPGVNYVPGKSLCKLGFPFHQITPVFDEKKDMFTLPEGAVPMPLFPMEGMFTRIIIAPAPGGEKENGKFIETSSPGLHGQCGGPVVDSEGAVWAIQSHTRHYPLGFSPPAPGQMNGAERQEHQFLNVGLGVHSEVILELLRSRNVEHKTSD